MHRIDRNVVRVAVIGLGKRGVAWAKTAIENNAEVHVFDPDIGERTPPVGCHISPLISQAIEAAQIVVVCVPERPALLRKLLQRIQSDAGRDTVILVDTNDISLEEAQSCARPSAAVFLAQVKTGRVTLQSNDQNSPRLVSLAHELVETVTGDGTLL